MLFALQPLAGQGNALACSVHAFDLHVDHVAHRKQLSEAHSLSDIERMFKEDKGMFNGFVSYAAKNGVKANWGQISTSRQIMEAQLKAYIARNSEFDSSAFYYFISPIDNTLLTAIKTLESND